METSTLEILPLPYASISRRFGAFVIDGFILGVLSVIGGHIIPVLGAVIVWFFYAPVLESSELRATLGKHLMGIQVADLSGRRLSIQNALIRNVVKIVSGLMLTIGFLFAFFTRRKQALHDLLADSVVVYGRSEMPVADAWIANSKAIFRTGQQAVHSAMPPAQDNSVVAQLERLQNLRAQGAISAEEYEAAKKKILG